MRASAANSHSRRRRTARSGGVRRRDATGQPPAEITRPDAIAAAARTQATIAQPPVRVANRHSARPLAAITSHGTTDSGRPSNRRAPPVHERWLPSGAEVAREHRDGVAGLDVPGRYGVPGRVKRDAETGGLAARKAFDRLPRSAGGATSGHQIRDLTPDRNCVAASVHRDAHLTRGGANAFWPRPRTADWTRRSPRYAVRVAPRGDRAAVLREHHVRACALADVVRGPPGSVRWLVGGLHDGLAARTIEPPPGGNDISPGICGDEHVAGQVAPGA